MTFRACFLSNTTILHHYVAFSTSVSFILASLLTLHAPASPPDWGQPLMISKEATLINMHIDFFFMVSQGLFLSLTRHHYALRHYILPYSYTHISGALYGAIHILYLIDYEYH